MKIAVAGATGRVGRPVVEILEARGHEVVPISRSTGVDLVTGHGLAEAMAGIASVIDVATGPSPEQEAATEFFMASAQNLLEAGQRAGVQRIVRVSIIGCDRFNGGYGAAMVAHEQALLAGPIPVRILRAAQFHEFIGQLVEWGTQGDVSYLQKMRIQPVSAKAVAEELVARALDREWSPASRPDEPILEIAGPREEELVDLAKRLVGWTGDPVRIEAVTDTADEVYDLHEEGGLLPGAGAKLAGPTFDEWLEATFGAPEQRVRQTAGAN